ncbi:hypothetical protein M885DRAFT_620019, partial [Pelagophyceae sp. CCMP2097]
LYFNSWSRASAPLPRFGHGRAFAAPPAAAAPEAYAPHARFAEHSRPARGLSGISSDGAVVVQHPFDLPGAADVEGSRLARADEPDVRQARPTQRIGGVPLVGPQRPPFAGPDALRDASPARAKIQRRTARAWLVRPARVHPRRATALRCAGPAALSGVRRRKPADLIRF